MVRAYRLHHLLPLPLLPALVVVMEDGWPPREGFSTPAKLMVAPISMITTPNGKSGCTVPS